MKVKPSNQNSF